MNLPLNILGEDPPGTESPCRFDPPVISMLLAPMPGPEAPEMDDVLQAISNYTGLELGVRVAPEEGTEANWACHVEIDGLPFPIAIWCDQSEDVQEATQDITDVECPWLLGIESILSPDDPLTNYINLVRLIAGSMPDIPVLHDSGSGHWLERSRIELDFMHEDLEPPEDILWRIEVHDLGEGTFNIMTAGLARCGRAELAMHEVPEPLRTAAVECISDLASLSLELAFPDSSGTLEIGPDLVVRFDPREPDEEDDPLIAVVIDDDTEAGLEHPAHVLDAIGGGDVAVYRTLRRTRQTTIRAQATWHIFLEACSAAIASKHEIDCLVQVPFEQVDAEDECREHLWLQVTEVKDTSVEARLVHEPRMVSGIDVGWTTTVEAEEVSNWLLRTPDGLVGPEDVDIEQAGDEA